MNCFLVISFFAIPLQPRFGEPCDQARSAVSHKLRQSTNVDLRVVILFITFIHRHLKVIGDWKILEMRKHLA